MENTENKSQPMYLLSYDHGGYILWGEYLKNQLQSAYDWLEKYPCFKIGLDNECFAYDIYSQISPDIITGIQDALKKYKNRFAIGSSTYGQPLSLFINEESNIRQITYAVYTNKKYFNSTPPVFVISEHALHSQIPQIIAQAGYSGAIMRTHFMMYGYNPTYASPFGWWEGSDGTRIRTVPTYYGEGAAFAVATLDNVILTRWPDNTPHSLEEFAEKFRDIKPLLASRFDDITLRCEGLVSHVEKNPGKYKFILLEELLDLYDKNPADAYVASPNNFKARMPWGYCGNEIWNNCRRAEINVITAEKLNAVAVLTNGNYSDNCAEIEESWKYLLAAQHHDVQICGLISDAREFLSKSLDLSEKAFQSSIKYLSGKISYEAGGTYVNVFNPNSWECASIVTAEIKFPRSASNLHYKGFYAVFDDDEKIPCDVQALDVKGGYIRRANITFCAKAAALTFKSYKIEGVEEPFAPEIKYEDNIINSKYYIVKLNENGIVSVYDKLSEKTVINSENGSLFKGVINGVACCSSGKWNVFAEGRGAKAVYHGDIGGISIIFTLSIRHDIKRLECHVRFFHNGELIGSVVDASKVQFHENTNGFIHEDKLCFALSPVFINNGQMTKIRDIPFMIAETETEQKYIQGNYWTAVSDSVNGVAVFNKGAMCSVYNNGELLIPLEYANHYVWGDRYLYGEYTHEFALIPFTDIWQKADIHRKALEYEYPFAVDVINNASARSGDKNIIAPAEYVGSQNAVLSALYTENGNIYARIYECEGNEASGVLKIKGASIEECNLLGEPTETDTGNKIGDNEKFFLNKHQIKTYKVNFER